jgi:hypothetical protein
MYRLLITWWFGLAYGRKRGEEALGPAVEGIESCVGRMWVVNARSIVVAKELTWRIPEVMNAGEEKEERLVAEIVTRRKAYVRSRCRNIWFPEARRT